MGRPPIPYDPDEAERFLDRMEGGEPIDDICGKDNIPGRKTIFRWRRENPDFAARYAIARENSAESCEQNAIREVMAATTGEGAQIARVRADVWRWAAAKRNPRTHGDKLDVNHSGQITLEAMVTSSLVAPIEARALPAPDGED